MTDPVNVVVTVSERGFDRILKDVEALRSELESLGIDMSGVEKRLNGIETASAKTSRAIQNTVASTRESTRATRDEIAGLKERLRTIKQSSTAEYDLARARKQTMSGAATASWDAQFAALSKSITNASREEEAALKRRTQTLKQATDAEYALNRARKQRATANASAMWDDEFNALTRAAAAQDKFANPSARYALYDVANAYTAIGVALSGVGVYAAVVGASFQSAFTNVARTTAPLDATDENLQSLRNSLVQLSGQIPLTFQQLSEIATIGNQMGIAADSVTDFTGTIARFASVSGVSIEEVTRSFGGFIAQTGLSEKYLENLGSAMALVSIRSNATEAQIISLTREIAASANSAGFSADEIVGLAGAFASLQVAPERARGVLDTYFNNLNKAVAEGGDAMAAFSNITGMTAESINNLVRSGEGAQVFQAVLSGLKANSADAVELTQNLDALGLSGLRANNTFLRFVNSLDVAKSSFATAREGFISGAELTRQYAQTVDDLSSQFTIFVNGVNAFIDAISGGGVESLADLLRMINNVVFAVTEWVGDNHMVAGILGFAAAVVAVTGTLLVVRGALLAATAATFAMRTAIAQMGGAAVASAGTLRGLIGALIGVEAGGKRAAFAMNLLKRTLPGLLITAGITALSFFAGGLFDVDDKAGDAALSLAEYNQATKFTGLGSQDAAGGADSLGNSLGGAGKAAEQAAVKIRTLVDYVNDLQGVFKRSSDLRFGSTSTMDEITLKWIELNEEVQKYQQQIRTLTADRALKEYWLSVATAYDDQIRAAQLREEIAKIDDDLAEAQAGASTELTGNSKAAIENRKVFRDLIGSYEEYVAALASAGASQEQIQAVISQLNNDFVAQATNLGYSGSELETYTARFSDLSTIIAKMPRDVNVAFDPNPALLALNEFFAKAEEQARAAGQGAGDAFGDGMGGGLGGWDPGSAFDAPLQKAERRIKPWWENLWDTLLTADFSAIIAAAGVEVIATINQFFTRTLPAWAEGARRWVGELWTGVQMAMRPFFEWLNTYVLNGASQIAIPGRQTGDTFGRSVSSGAQSALDQSDPVAAWQNRINNNAYNNGANVGRNMGNGVLRGLTDALSGRNVGAVFSKNGAGYSLGGYVSGFSGGGYTGTGHWLQPAGVVHKGEYVVPKKHVDQRTGLPDANYVANLQRGKSAPKSGYATGGFVGGGFSGPIDLSASTLNYLANAVSVKLNVGSEQLAKTTSRGDRRLAFTGSN